MTTELLTVSVSAFIATCDALSDSMTTKLDVPVALGVPASSPVEVFSEMPAGSTPEETDHVYGEVPPVAAAVSE